MSNNETGKIDWLMFFGGTFVTGLYYPGMVCREDVKGILPINRVG